MPSGEGRLLESNKAFEDMMGYSREELLSLSLNDLYFDPQEREHCLNQITAAGGSIAHECQLKKKDGTAMTAAMTCVAVKDPRGEIIYIDSIVEDITSRKMAEEESRLASEKLRELYQFEKLQRQELEEEARARGLFIDVLAHELRTPLTPVLVSGSILRDILAAQPEDVQYRLVSNVLSSAQTLAGRLEELLELGRCSRGTFTLTLQPVDLAQFLKNIAGRFRAEVNRSRRQFAASIADNLPVTMIDQSRMEQVITTCFQMPENSARRTALSLSWLR
jgi:PAS domain S-box-containing protein